MSCYQSPSRLRLATLDDEPGRLRSLDRYAVLDSGHEPQFDQIVALVRDILNVPIATVSLVDQNRQWFKARIGLAIEQTERRVSFCDHTIRAREVMVVEDAALDPRFVGNVLVTSDPFIRSYAGAPLMTPDGYNLGALCAIDRVPRTFTPSQLGMLQRFAALAVEGFELRTAVNQDFLTGALTRRALVEKMEKAVRHHAVDSERAALVAFDIDHFKSVNDRFGHSVGDQVLRLVVSECRAGLRGGHALGRLGGEEFAILMPGARLEEAQRCAERMRAAISGARAKDCPAVTASFGIAALETGSTVEQWLASADHALYGAKSAGRDRCVVSRRGDEAAAA